MVYLLLQTKPRYEAFIHVIKHGTHIIYVKLNKAMYGCIIAENIFYENLVETLVTIGFDINPYDMCVANTNINGT